MKHSPERCTDLHETVVDSSQEEHALMAEIDKN